MAIRKVVPGSLTDAYKLREGDFSPSLVGNQFTDPNAFFTLGNFAVTSNFEGRVGKDFKLGEWSDYYNLDNLDMTQEQLDQMISNNIFVRLNFDKTNLERYVYFGSFAKFLESEIQDVILKWPASLYISSNPIQPTTSRPSNINTVLDFVYDPVTNKSYFKTPKSGVNNPYSLDFSRYSFGPDNIPQQIYNYVLANQQENEFVINDMTGSTTDSNYIYFEIEGNPFPTLTGTTFGKRDFHIKPVKSIRNEFFNNLSDFQKLLLDKLTIPKYTFIVNVPVKYDDGDIGFSKKSFTWPTTDGYNLDINTLNYSNYIENFFKVASLYDQNKTDLVVRRMVSDSIIEYDTEGDGTEATGQRVSKLLRIYGAEFDVVKKYINGISFANVVTYNKKDNTSDNLIKMMAKTLGFDVLLATSGGFSLLENDDPSDDPVFQGYSRSLSPKEIDIELWRRLVINAWWLFRSKGTRKVLEFFLKLFGINSCLVSMDELIYLAKDKLDLFQTREQFNQLLGPDFFDLNFDTLPFDVFGFPKVPTDTDDFWFQNDGFWYNGGNESVIGNNPHYGPYDYGQRYWSKFTCFIEDFQPIVNINRTETITTNYFNEYNNGTFTPNDDGQAFSNYGVEVPQFFVNPNDNINVISAGLVTYGEENGPINVRDTGDTYSLRITFQAGESDFCNNCPPINSFGDDGLILVQGAGKDLVPHDIEECCDFYWLPQENTTPVTPIDNSGTIDPINDSSSKLKNNFNLDMVNTKVLPSKMVDCTNSTPGVPTIINNPTCVGSGCPDTSYGTLVVNSNTSVTLTFNVFGGSKNSCCNGTANLQVNGAPNLLSSTYNQNNSKNIILGPGTYDLKLSLLNYSCPDVYTSIEVTENVSIIDGITLLNTRELKPIKPILPVGPIKPNPQDGTLPEEEQNKYYCWWCPPTDMIKRVCDSKAFLDNINLTENGVINLAISYGYNGNDITEAEDYLIGIFNTYFIGGNCLFMVNGELLKNRDCCEIRGGTWNEELRLCELPAPPNPCSLDNVTVLYSLVGQLIDNTQPVGESNFDVLSESCCESLGYYYGLTSRPIYNLDGTITNSLVDQQSVNLLNDLYPENPRVGCFVCPTEYKETQLTGNNNTTIITITDLVGNNISESCCTSLGYEHTTLTDFSEEPICLKCGTTPVLNQQANTVVDLNGDSLTETCCTQNGYYYYNGTEIDPGCYICPPFVTDSYSIVVTNINGTNYTLITDSNGETLSPNCCSYYQEQTGNPKVVYAEGVGCIFT